MTYPQVLVNVRVREKKDLRAVPEIAAAMERVEARLAGQGRLLVRYSGTEPLLRVMLEGRDQQEIQALGSGDRGQSEGAPGVTPLPSSASTSTRSRRFATRAAGRCRA